MLVEVSFPLTTRKHFERLEQCCINAMFHSFIH
uniref:Uncharacterized protein n=1 Tax=Anguilla anguilla TaxID=7936 RepID=A0A0E9SVP8_ANGAN